uniref:Uncharacterized protein n=1 Tax=Ditylenchus dipsaci TaxID=166011 RepID=A0A915EBF5_9BILA
MPPTSGPVLPSTAAIIERHVDVDELIEDYAWRMFKDMIGFKKASNLDGFKHLEKEEAEFTINRKRLNLVHDEPSYRNVQQTGHNPSTLFKSVFTNNTSESQAYSLKMERTTESICGVAREQGFAFGAEAELSLKTPCEIAELKTNFKYENHFNTLQENIKSEALTWGVDNNIIVPGGGQIEASVVVEELSYSGHYTLISNLSGMVSVTITRIRDGVLVLPLSFNIATVFQHYLTKNDPRLKGVVTMENNKVKLTSKGTCHFQFAVKQHIELNDVKGRRNNANTHGSNFNYAAPYPVTSPTHPPPNSEMARINFLQQH